MNKEKNERQLALLFPNTRACFKRQSTMVETNMVTIEKPCRSLKKKFDFHRMTSGIHRGIHKRWIPGQTL
ncbi:hypothetical protein CR164_07610 [Prosthecochloris marina]|uniref:Uncharacterized protein n=2 Tax=Chlorobiaceae TaxID=191412 RepID=A0A317T6E6_9CHLB|nr:hypothetical protein CR164_07610 [Prosthecochloris marina]